MMPEGMDVLTGSTTVLSQVTAETMPDTIKTVFTALLFGGGLIPATISANKAMFTKMGGENSDSSNDNPATSLDPTAGQKVTYIADSGASGPELPNAALIFPNEKIPLVDIVAIAGRIDGLDSVADWRNLPSAKLEGLSDPENPPMWLPRATFKANIRKNKFKAWPTDPTSGLPLGGEDLKKAELPRVSKPGALIGDAALDAVFDTWAWGSSVATPDKVTTQLNDWRRGDSLDVNKFAGAATRGRAVTVAAAVTFVVIQIIAYGSLFVAPALRVFLDVDIGFGSAGSCGEAGCLEVWKLFS